MCSCGRDQVLHACTVPQCPSYATQKIFCTECNDSEEKHPHKTTHIILLIKRIVPKWDELKTLQELCYSKCRPQFKKYGSLIKYLEKELVDSKLFSEQPATSNIKLLLQDFTNFEAFQRRYDDSKNEIEQSMLNIKLFDILSKEQTHTEYQRQFESQFAHLCDITEERIYQNYKCVIELAGKDPLDGLEPENIELFYKFKRQLIQEESESLNQPQHTE